MTVKNKLQQSNLSEQDIAAQLEMSFDAMECVARTRDGLRRLLSYALTTGHLKGLQKAAENYNAIFKGEPPQGDLLARTPCKEVLPS